jgi:hypothetical protein
MSNALSSTEIWSILLGGATLPIMLSMAMHGTRSEQRREATRTLHGAEQASALGGGQPADAGSDGGAHTAQHAVVLRPLQQGRCATIS